MQEWEKMRDKVKDVQEVLEKIRPALERHHGDLKVLDIKEDKVFLQFEGACNDCPIMDASIKDVVVMTIKGNLPWVQDVQIVQSKYSII